MGDFLPPPSFELVYDPLNPRVVLPPRHFLRCTCAVWHDRFASISAEGSTIVVVELALVRTKLVETRAPVLSLNNWLARTSVTLIRGSSIRRELLKFLPPWLWFENCKNETHLVAETVLILGQMPRASAGEVIQLCPVLLSSYLIHCRVRKAKNVCRYGYVGEVLLDWEKVDSIWFHTAQRTRTSLCLVLALI